MKTMTVSQFREAYSLAMQGIALDFMNVLVETCPVDTGNLKNQIDIKLGKNKSTISMPIYGMYLEFGTPPHIISPTSKKALYWEGAKHPVKVVHHPGTRPQPFIRSAINNQLGDIIRKNLKRQFA